MHISNVLAFLSIITGGAFVVAAGPPYLKFGPHRSNTLTVCLSGLTVGFVLGAVLLLFRGH